MSVKIRLTRMGARNAAAFRVVAADSRSPRDGRFLEILGWYDPKIAKSNFDVKLDRIDYWKGQGAEVSNTVQSLVKRKQAEPVVAVPEPPVKAPVEVAEVPVEADVEEDVLVATEA